MNAFDKYSVQALSPVGFPAKAAEIKRAFREAYGHDLQMTRQHDQLATEVQFCLDKSWELIECPLNEHGEVLLKTEVQHMME